MVHDGAMTDYIVLLRAINVAGKNKIPMAELREMLHGLGYTDARTYIQSGNIALSTRAGAPSIAKKIHKGIDDTFGYDVDVIVRTIEQLQMAVDGCPYADQDPKRVGVIFLADTFDGELDTSRFTPDECAFAGDHIYVHCPTTFAESKLTNGWFEKQTGIPSTMRNWNSTNKLLAMFDA